MNKSVKNLSIVGLINFVNLGLGLVLFTAVATKLSLEDFGIYSLLTLLLVSISKIIDFGSNSNFVTEYLSKSKNQINELINYKIISFLITIFISYLFIFIFNGFNDLVIYAIFILGLFFYMCNYLFFALFQKDEDFFKASLLNFFPALVKSIFGILILLNILSIDLTTAFGIFSISMFFSWLVGFLKFKEITNNFVFNFNILGFVKKFYQAGISQLINDSLGTTTSQITKFLRDLTDLGTFSMASKLSNVFSVISYSIYTVILTSNSKRKLESKSYNLNESVILGGILILISMIGSIISPYAFSFLFGDKFSNSVVLFNILLFSGSISSIHRFLDNFFFIEGKSHILLRITLFKIGLLTILGFLLTSSFGLIGLVVADLIVSITITSITFFYILRNL